MSTLSSHLRILRSAGLTSTRRDGTHIYYSLADGSIPTLLLALRRVAEHRSSQLQRLVADYLEGRGDLDAIGEADIERMLAAGDVTLVDVRPRTEFEAGHIPGAISLPLDEVDAVAAREFASKSIVAYCRDRYCVLAPEAARRLKAHGIDTSVLDGGFTEWIASADVSVRARG